MRLAVRTLAPFAFSAVALTHSLACGSAVSSDDYPTSDLWADLTVTAEGESTRVNASLRTGALSTTWVDLVGEDHFTASLDGDEVELNESQLLGIVGYSTTFERSAPDSEVVITLHRGEHRDAESRATLPAYLLADPLDVPDEVSRTNDDIDLRWQPAADGDPVTITASGACVETFEKVLTDDDGDYTIAGGTLTFYDPRSEEEREGATEADDAAARRCTVSVSLKRSRAGDLGGAYGGGTLNAARTQRLGSFQSVP